MKKINQFLLKNDIRISSNPCVSPDFCLDWDSLKDDIKKGDIVVYDQSRVSTQEGVWHIVSNKNGDHAWKLTDCQQEDAISLLEDGFGWGEKFYYPASYENLINMKNVIFASDPESTVFARAGSNLSSKTLGIGARFTTLHWPGVFWVMKHLGIGLTANQNSIPRELVYDVDKMLEGKLDKCPFPFIGTDVPEGHQGQSVQGMSHGNVLENLKTGFHLSRIPWSFNADHQPIGGKYDSREDDLVSGCLFASYITFDLSPELIETNVPESNDKRKAWVETHVDDALVEKVRMRISSMFEDFNEEDFNELLCYVWPAMLKMKARDAKYRAIRVEKFNTPQSQEYIRELSIDELPGLTRPETTAIMLSLCELMEMPVDFVAPAFGFQKNMPYPDNEKLRSLIEEQWNVCKHFGVSIGFHSGSGKSAENYQVMGEVTGSNLEIKTSGRYTYEMGIALHSSSNEDDQRLWRDWFEFTIELAAQGAFSVQKTEKEMARSFILDAYKVLKRSAPSELFTSVDTCEKCLRELPKEPDLMFWFEYNFLYVLAANGSAEKKNLGDHSALGYAQRKRFYTISEEGRLNFCKQVAKYIIFLAENTGLVDSAKCDAVRAKLNQYEDYNSFILDIGCEK